MSFTAQDFWRKRKRSSSLSFFLNVLILLFLLISGISGVLQAEEKALLEFTDNDSRGGWLSGDLIFTVPESISSTEKSAKISKYVLRWGNNPHQRLGMFLPIVSLRPRNPAVERESSLKKPESLQEQPTFCSMPAMKMKKKLNIIASR